MSLFQNLTTRLLYNKALNFWGERAQLDQVIEEAAELIVAVNHYKRRRAGSLREVIEEMADMTIMLGQLLELLDDHRDEYTQVVDYKIQRLRERLLSYEEKSNLPPRKDNLFS